MSTPNYKPVQQHSNKITQPVGMAPNDTDREKDLVGGLLAGLPIEIVLKERLKPEHFFNQRFGDYYREILSVYEEFGTVSYSMVRDRLLSKGLLTEGDPNDPNRMNDVYDFSMLRHVPPLVPMRAYAQAIRQDSELRTLIDFSSRLATMAHNRKGSPVEIHSWAMRELANLRPFEINQDQIRGENMIMAYEHMLQDMIEHPVWFPAPWDSMAESVPMFMPGSLIVFGGPEGSGKSTILFNAAIFYAKTHGSKVAYIHTEMNARQVQQRLRVSQSPKLNYNRLLRPGELSQVEQEELNRVDEMLSTWIHRLHSWHARKIYFDELVTEMQRLVDEEGTSVFCIDYINDVKNVIQKNRLDTLVRRDMLADLEEFANRNNVLVLTATQLNNQGNAYQEGRAVNQKSTIYYRMETTKLEHDYSFKYDGIDYLYEKRHGINSPVITIHAEKVREGGYVSKFELFLIGPRYLFVDPTPALLSGRVETLDLGDGYNA